MTTMTGNLLVSVVIPNRNRTSVLYRAIMSVVNQSYKNWEIIVVDDSDEEIFKEIKEHYRDMENIHIYRGDKKGDYGARCKGFALSKGEYVAFLDSDDYWDANKLEKHVRVLADHDNVAVSWDNLYREKLNGEKVRVAPFNRGNAGGIVPQRTILKEMIKENFIHMSCGVIRKNAITNTGGPFMESPFDYVLWINLATRYPFAHIDEYLTIKTDSLDWLGSDKRVLFRENWNITKLKLSVLSKYHDQLTKREVIYSLIRVIFMSIGIHVLMPPNMRKFFKPLLYFTGVAIK
jgi:glycosyltransferase involved in cell wall biosynthesis